MVRWIGGSYELMAKSGNPYVAEGIRGARGPMIIVKHQDDMKHF